MSVRIENAIAEILKATDDQDNLSWADVAHKVFLKVKALQKEAAEASEDKASLVVVGQILFPGEEKPHVVALGPFGGRAVGAAKKAGEGLAWDSRTGLGKGRYMVVPAFSSARAAWMHYGETKPEIEEDLIEMNHIQRTISDGPVCECGLRASTYCHRHQKEL